MDDILGDILSITAAEEAEKQAREQKAAGPEGDLGFDIQIVSKLLNAVSPDLLPFAQKLIALAVEVRLFLMLCLAPQRKSFKNNL